MEFYAAVRLAVAKEGLSHHEAGRRFGIDRRTVKKMLCCSAPPGYRRARPVRRPKPDGFTGIIDAILEADADPEVPRKQRHTAHWIFERLRDEHGFTATLGRDTLISTERPRGQSQISSRRTASAIETRQASSSSSGSRVARCSARSSKRSRWVS